MKQKVYTKSMLAELRQDIIMHTSIVLMFQREYKEAVGHEYEVPVKKLSTKG